jgi:hypothetical protein
MSEIDSQTVQQLTDEVRKAGNTFSRIADLMDKRIEEEGKSTSKAVSAMDSVAKSFANALQSVQGDIKFIKDFSAEVTSATGQVATFGRSLNSASESIQSFSKNLLGGSGFGGMIATMSELTKSYSDSVAQGNKTIAEKIDSLAKTASEGGEAFRTFSEIISANKDLIASIGASSEELKGFINNLEGQIAADAKLKTVLDEVAKSSDVLKNNLYDVSRMAMAAGGSLGNVVRLANFDKFVEALNHAKEQLQNSGDQVDVAGLRRAIDNMILREEAASKTYDDMNTVAAGLAHSLIGLTHGAEHAGLALEKFADIVSASKGMDDGRSARAIHEEIQSRSAATKNLDQASGATKGLFGNLIGAAQSVDTFRRQMNGNSKPLFLSQIQNQAPEEKKGQGFFSTVYTGLQSAINSMVANIKLATGSTGDMQSAFLKLLVSIPLVGGALELLYNVVANQTKQFREFRDVGQNFSGSLVAMSMAAARSGLSLDEFAALIKENSTLAQQFGGGAEGLGEFTRAVRQASQEFGLYGYSITDLNKVSSTYAETLRELGVLPDFKTAGSQLTQSAQMFAEDIDKSSRSFGKSRKAILEDTSAALRDTTFFARIQGLSAKEQEAFVKAAQTSVTALAGLPGQMGKDLPKALTQTMAIGSAALTELGQTFVEAGMPQLTGILQNMADATKADAAQTVADNEAVRAGQMSQEEANARAQERARKSTEREQQSIDVIRDAINDNAQTLMIQSRAGNKSADYLLQFSQQLGKSTAQERLRAMETQKQVDSAAKLALNLDNIFAGLSADARAGLIDKLLNPMYQGVVGGINKIFTDTGLSARMNVAIDRIIKAFAKLLGVDLTNAGDDFGKMIETLTSEGLVKAADAFASLIEDIPPIINWFRKWGKELGIGLLALAAIVTVAGVVVTAITTLATIVTTVGALFGALSVAGEALAAAFAALLAALGGAGLISALKRMFGGGEKPSNEQKPSGAPQEPAKAEAKTETPNAKPAEPAAEEVKPAEKPAEAAKPAEEAKPAEPAKPAEAAEPAKPAETPEPAKPAEAAEAEKPAAEPQKPAEPVEPAKPAEGAQPAQPEKAPEPQKPAEAAEPQKPSAPEASKPESAKMSGAEAAASESEGVLSKIKGALGTLGKMILVGDAVVTAGEKGLEAYSSIKDLDIALQDKKITQEDYDKRKAEIIGNKGGETAGHIGGMIAGAEAGGLLGSQIGGAIGVLGGPLGIAAGEIVGGLLGGIGGALVATPAFEAVGGYIGDKAAQAYNALTGKSSDDKTTKPADMNSDVKPDIASQNPNEPQPEPARPIPEPSEQMKELAAKEEQRKIASDIKDSLSAYPAPMPDPNSVEKLTGALIDQQQNLNPQQPQQPADPNDRLVNEMGRVREAVERQTAVTAGLLSEGNRYNQQSAVAARDQADVGR